MTRIRIMSTSTRVGTRISSRVNKLAGRKVADRDTVQQICDQAGTRKLMTWLDTVLQDDALTEAEYHKWEELQAREIDDLFAPEDLKLPGLRCEKSLLEAEIAELQQELLDSEEREKLHATQHGILAEQLQRTRELATKSAFRIGSDGDAVKVTAAGKVLQHRYEKQLDNLEAVVQEHIKLHQQDEEAAMFLSSLDFDPYVNSELAYTKALGQYTEKLFFRGIASVPGNPRDCALVGLEGKENRSQGVSYKKVRDTVRRVKSTYLRKQEENITEAVNLAANQTKIKTLKSLIADLTNDKFPKDEETLSRMAEEYSIRAIKKEDDLKLRWTNEGVSLMEDLKTLQDVSILCGNYTLKLARQNFFMSRQDKVIDNLISQLSRQELLQIMLHHENKMHRASAEQLQEIVAHISILNKSLVEQRTLTAGDDAILPVKAHKLCLGSADKTLSCLVEMLQSYVKQGSHSMFHTFDDITHALKQVFAESNASRDAAAQSDKTVAEIMSRLELNVSRCAKCLDKGFTSTTHQEEVLGSSLAELELLANTLQQDFQTKSEAIKSNEAVSIARKLFVYFFTDPVKLSEILQGDSK